MAVLVDRVGLPQRPRRKPESLPAKALRKKQVHVMPDSLASSLVLEIASNGVAKNIRHGAGNAMKRRVTRLRPRKYGIRAASQLKKGVFAIITIIISLGRRSWGAGIQRPRVMKMGAREKVN
jgi:hypothetical protein